MRHPPGDLRFLGDSRCPCSPGGTPSSTPLTPRAFPPGSEERSACSLPQARLQVSRRKWEPFQGLPRTFAQALAAPRPALPPRSDTRLPCPCPPGPSAALTPVLLPAPGRHIGPRCPGRRPGTGPARGYGARGAALDAPVPSGRCGLRQPRRTPPGRARLRPAPEPPAAGSRPSVPAVPEKSARAATCAPHSRSTQDSRRRSRAGCS